jgi:hypothetical protein
LLVLIILQLIQKKNMSYFAVILITTYSSRLLFECVTTHAPYRHESEDLKSEHQRDYL